MSEDKTLTIKTKGGQTAKINWGQFPIELDWGKGKGEFFATLKYQDAINLGFSVPETFKKKDIRIQVIEKQKAYDLRSADWEQERTEKEKIINSAKIVGFEYIIGCDAQDSFGFYYDFPKNTKWEIKRDRRDKDSRLAAYVKDLIRNSGMERNIEEAPYTYGGWKIDREQTLKLIEKAKKEMLLDDKKVEIKKQEKEKEVKAIYQKAKETGEKQMLEFYSTECCEPDFDCDIDNVTTYAMPDGSKKIVRVHCH